MASVDEQATPTLQERDPLLEPFAHDEQATPTLQEGDPLLEPFTHGWRRELVYRNEASVEGHKRSDAYYATPAGKKLRSLRQIKAVLKETGSRMSISCFSMGKRLLGVGLPQEIERQADQPLQWRGFGARRRQRSKRDHAKRVVVVTGRESNPRCRSSPRPRASRVACVCERAVDRVKASGLHIGRPAEEMSLSPPRTPARSSALDIDAVVEAVITRLTSAGTIGAARATSESVPESDERKPVVGVEVTATGSSFVQHRLWLEELRAQHISSVRFGTREREEVRALLVIGDGGGPPSDHHAWYWARVRLMLIVAHHGWAPAIDDARTSDMDKRL